MLKESRKAVNKFINEQSNWEETNPVINVSNSKLGTVISVTSTITLPLWADNTMYRLVDFKEHNDILKALSYSNRFVNVNNTDSDKFTITARAFHNEVDDYNENKGILLAKVRLGEAINRLKAKYSRETVEILTHLTSYYTEEFKKYKNLQSNKVDRIVEIASE